MSTWASWWACCLSAFLGMGCYCPGVSAWGSPPDPSHQDGEHVRFSGTAVMEPLSLQSLHRLKPSEPLPHTDCEASFHSSKRNFQLHPDCFPSPTPTSLTPTPPPPTLCRLVLSFWTFSHGPFQSCSYQRGHWRMEPSLLPTPCQTLCQGLSEPG